MKIHLTGRHLRLTKPIREYVQGKVEKAQKFFDHIVWAQVVVSVEKRAHQCEIVIHASKQTFRSLAKAASVYAAVDLASDKIDKQLRKYKERLKDRHKHAASTPQTIADKMVAETVRFSVVKDVPLRPMSPDDAAEEMDRLGYTFWMFQNRDSKKINVIFRRLDDTFGLLQPSKKVGR